MYTQGNTMLAKSRLLAILTVLALLSATGVVRAQEDYPDEDRGNGFPQRLQNFGRSLVGGYKNNDRGQQPQQRPMRNTQQQQQQPAGPDYNAGFGDEQAARPRPTGAQPAGSRRQAPAATQPASQARAGGAAPTTRRPVDSDQDFATGLPATNARGEIEPAQNKPRNVERTARAVGPSRGDDMPPPAERRAASDTVVVKQSTPSISVETVGPRKMSVGKQATYKLVLKNSGEMAAHDVVVTVAVPDFAEVVEAKATTGATEPSPGQDGLCWKLNSLGGDSREELSLDIVPHKSQAFDLAVRWSQAPLASQTTVEVQEPKLALALEGPKDVLFGERAVYKLLLSNPGSGDAENVVITLMPLNPGDGPPASHPLGVLHPSDSKTIEIELIARQAGQVSIQAEAKAAGDVKASLNEEVQVRRAALAVAAAGPKLQYAGTPAAYEIHVQNTGNAAAKDLHVHCRLPRGAEYVSCSNAGHHSADTGAVEWTIASLEPGGDLKLTLKSLLKSSGDNQFEITCAAEGDLKQTAAATTHVEAVADLAMEVSDQAGPVLVGSETVYEIRIRNRGTKNAEAVDVTAFFSTGIEPVAVEGGAHEIKPGMVVLRTIDSLDAGKERIYKIKARADAPGNHRFRAELNCKPLDTKLTAEEATLFYSESGDAAK